MLFVVCFLFYTQYLEGLCSKKVPFGEQVKKSSLFCKNSIKKTTKLSQLLRGYAHNHPYMETFPACLQMAVDHFNVCLKLSFVFSVVCKQNV